MILSQVTHYPKPEKESQLIEAMRAFGEVIDGQPGLIFANAFKDQQAGSIIAISVWESIEAMQAAGPALRGAIANVPFEDLEIRPRELRVLTSVV